MSFNLATMLRESAKATPDKPLIHVGDISLTYQQIDELSGRVASSLLALDLEPGDKVAVQLPNLPQFVFAYFGIVKAGLVMVPLNPLLRLPEVEYHLRDSDAKVLITFAPMGEEAAKAAQAVGGVRTYAVTLPGADDRPEGTEAFDDLYLAEDTGHIEPLSPDETAVLLYTSGTTGRPKGAELTHFQLFMAATTGGDLFGFEPDDVALAVLPLFHVFGLSSILNTGVRFGGTIVLVPRFEIGAGARRDGAPPHHAVPRRAHDVRRAAAGRHVGSRPLARCGSASPVARRSPARSSGPSRRSSPAS